MHQVIKPDHIYDAIVSAVAADNVAPTTSTCANGVGEILLGNTDAVPYEITYAFDTYLNPYKREVVEAFIIAGADAKHIHEVLRIPVEVMEVYLEVFFDVNVFRDRLDLESYVREYPRDHDEGYGADLKLSALDKGLHWISVKFGRHEYDVPAAAALKETIGQAYYYAKEGHNAKLTSLEAREARQWASSLTGNLKAKPDIIDTTANAQDALKFDLRLIKAAEANDGDGDVPSPDDLITEPPAPDKK